MNRGRERHGVSAEGNEPAGSSGEEGRAEGDAAASEEPSAEASGTRATDVEPDAIDYKDRWLRAEAELQNFRRRARRDLDEIRQATEERVLLDMVTLLDDLERALQAAQDAGATQAWTEGVALVAQRARETLARYGVTVVDPAGEPFDPRLHEAVLEAEPSAGMAPGTVSQVVHKGYRLGERALRPARVVVARHHSGGVD